MTSKYKIIFVDIDCTLLDHTKKPSRYDKASIRYLNKLQKKGIKVFICTARPFHSVKQIHLLDLLKADGAIFANGGMITYQNQIIYKTDMPLKDFHLLCELTMTHGYNLEGIRPYDCFLINDNIEEAKKLFSTYPENVPNVEDYHNQQVIGVNLFAPREIDEIFLKKLPKSFYYFRYHDFGVDVAHVPHKKGEAVKFVLSYLNINKDEAISFGDDIADISMFKETGTGVAMDNAKDELKEVADYITTSVSKHGIKRFLSSKFFTR